MAFTTKSVGPHKKVSYSSETVTLGNATTVYSSAIPNISPDPSVENNFVVVVCTASAVSGTNLDVSLYGSDAEDGTFVQLLDAVVADITTTAAGVGRVDLNAYPAGYYKIGVLSDADETANTIDVEVFS